MEHFSTCLDEEDLLILLALQKRRKEKSSGKYSQRFWVRKGAYEGIVREARLHDEEFFFRMFRMTPTKFEQLLNWVAPIITKSSVKREAISADERLCVTMRHLASGDSYLSLSSQYRIGVSTISKIVSETSKVIWVVLLKEGFLDPPKTTSDWKKIADDFENKWNFPNCLGAIDGKHIMIQCPANTGSLFFNYKKHFSIILMAVCDANYRFTMVDIGEAGRQSDAGVFSHSLLGKSIINEQLSSPVPRKLQGTDSFFPYVFIGDDAFPL